MSCEDVLLLGGGGFIGSALARRLKKKKIPIHVVGRNKKEQLERLLPECGTVVHLASTTTPGSSADHPALEMDNLALTLQLLDLLQTQPETHLIFFSSGGTIYGNPERLPVTEDSATAPLSHHGAGKAAQEAFCQSFRAQGHAVTILRPSNTYGPGQALKSGFGLIRTMLEHVRRGTPLAIWGDGESVRDFIYIDDISEACTRLLALPQDNGTYNLGSGKGYSINQVRSIVEQITGAELKTTYHPARSIDVASLILDTSRLEQRLSWKPSTSIEEGVQQTWLWLTKT